MDASERLGTATATRENKEEGGGEKREEGKRDRGDKGGDEK